MRVRFPLEVNWRLTRVFHFQVVMRRGYLDLVWSSSPKSGAIVWSNSTWDGAPLLRPWIWLCKRWQTKEPKRRWGQLISSHGRQAWCRLLLGSIHCREVSGIRLRRSSRTVTLSLWRNGPSVTSVVFSGYWICADRRWVWNPWKLFFSSVITCAPWTWRRVERSLAAWSGTTRGSSWWSSGRRSRTRRRRRSPSERPSSPATNPRRRPGRRRTTPPPSRTATRKRPSRRRTVRWKRSPRRTRNPRKTSWKRKVSPRRRRRRPPARASIRPTRRTSPPRERPGRRAPPARPAPRARAPPRRRLPRGRPRAGTASSCSWRKTSSATWTTRWVIVRFRSWTAVAAAACRDPFRGTCRVESETEDRRDENACSLQASWFGCGSRAWSVGFPCLVLLAIKDRKDLDRMNSSCYFKTQYIFWVGRWVLYAPVTLGHMYLIARCAPSKIPSKRCDEMKRESFESVSQTGLDRTGLYSTRQITCRRKPLPLTETFAFCVPALYGSLCT